MKKLLLATIALFACSSLVQAGLWEDIQQKIEEVKQDPRFKEAAEKLRAEAERLKQGTERTAGEAAQKVKQKAGETAQEAQGWLRTKTVQKMSDADLAEACAEKERRAKAKSSGMSWKELLLGK